MSVILYEAEDIGALAWAVLCNTEYKSAMQIPRDRYEAIAFKMDYEAEEKFVKCFFDRLYIANQLAFYTTYSGSGGDGSFKVDRLQEENIRPFNEGRFKKLASPRGMNEALRSLRYNLASNAGRTFFDEEDTQRLEQLIECSGNEVIRQTNPDRAAYEGD